MAIGPYGGGYCDEDRADQEITGDFLGPRGRVVERVASKELVEDVGREYPEESECNPGFEGVMRQVDRRVGDVHVRPGVQEVLFSLPRYGGRRIGCLGEACGA